MKQLIAPIMPNLEGGGVQQIMLHVAGGLLARGVAVELCAGLARCIHRPPLDYLAQSRLVALFAVLPYANLVADRTARHASSHPRVILSENSEPVARLKHGGLREFPAFPSLKHLYYQRADSIVAVLHDVAAGSARLTRLPREHIRVVYNPAVSPDLLRARGRFPHRLDHQPVLGFAAARGGGHD